MDSVAVVMVRREGGGSRVGGDLSQHINYGTSYVAFPISTIYLFCQCDHIPLVNKSITQKQTMAI